MREMSLSPPVQKHKALSSWQQALIAVLFLCGIVLRLRQYLTDRSLWLDEAMLALNIVQRDFAGLTKPLDYDQGAPIGFLWLEKVFNLILGRSEFALRLFPLLAGLASLWLFYLLLKRITSGMGLLTVFALFALNPQLIYYSSEVKQYILDVVVTLGLLFIAAPLWNEGPERRNFIRLGLAGLLALWFSHPALFMLAGIGLALVILCVQQRDYSSLKLVIGIGLVWLANVSLLYFITLRGLSQNTFILDYWKDAFIPIPPWSDWGWFLAAFQNHVHFLLGLTSALWLVFLLILAGWLALWFEQRMEATAFAFIFLIALIASALRLYPTMERLGLFLVPLELILIGKSVETLSRGLRARPTLALFAALALSGYLLYGPVTTSLEYFLHPKYYEHIRPSMAYLESAWKEGDEMYISYGAVPAFRYYAPAYGLEKIHYEAGQHGDYSNPPIILQRLDSFKGQKRVWILMSHVYEKEDFNEKDFLLTYLDQMGEKKREFRQAGTSVYLYLYDLSKCCNR